MTAGTEAYGFAYTSAEQSDETDGVDFITDFASGEDLLVFDFATNFEGNYVSDAAAIAAIGGVVNETAYSQSSNTLSINSFDLANLDVLHDYTIHHSTGLNI